MPRIPRPLEERFWEKVDKSGNCWEWTAALANGYGVINIGYKKGTKQAHIVSYEFAYGSRKGLWVLHKCDNRKCVNPDHLFLGRADDNNQDMINKGRAWFQGRISCYKGHPYNDKNTYIDTDGRKRCRICRRANRAAKATLAGRRQI